MAAQNTQPTQLEEEQAKEFLKRAEVRTMRKDLAVLREADSVKERNKIAEIKTLDEQLQIQQQQAKEQLAKVQVQAASEVAGRQQILERHEGEEAAAESQLKQYASEAEKQQIFLFESQKLELQKQAEKIDAVDLAKLALDKNAKLLETQKAQKILNAIISQETGMQEEQRVIENEAQTTNLEGERKALEQRKWELDAKIQEVEKNRWVAEKQLQDLQAAITQIDKQSELWTQQRNGIRDTILGIEKSLRDVYSGVIEQEDKKKAGLLDAQKIREAATEKQHAQLREQVRREQSLQRGKQPGGSGFIDQAPEVVKERLAEESAKEDVERRQFEEEIDTAVKESPQPNQPPQPPLPPQNNT